MSVIKLGNYQLNYSNFPNNNFVYNSYPFTPGSKATIYIYHPAIGEFTQSVTIPESLTNITTIPDDPGEWSTCSSIIVTWSPVVCDKYKLEISLYDQNKNWLRGWIDYTTNTTYTYTSEDLTYNQRATFVNISVSSIGCATISDFYNSRIEICPILNEVIKSNLP